MSTTADRTDAAETTGTTETTETGDAEQGAETVAEETARENLSRKQRRILSHLADNAEQTYFKSRLIAEDLGLSAKEVGANMRAIQREEVGLTVEKWGYSSGTTWMVTAEST